MKTKSIILIYLSIIIFSLTVNGQTISYEKADVILRELDVWGLGSFGHTALYWKWNGGDPSDPGNHRIVESLSSGDFGPVVATLSSFYFASNYIGMGSLPITAEQRRIIMDFATSKTSDPGNAIGYSIGGPLANEFRGYYPAPNEDYRCDGLVERSYEEAIPLNGIVPNTIDAQVLNNPIATYPTNQVSYLQLLPAEGPQINFTNNKDLIYINGNNEFIAHADDGINGSGTQLVQFWHGSVPSDWVDPPNIGNDWHAADIEDDYSYIWNTIPFNDGVKTIYAKGFDQAGNSTISTGIDVFINNIDEEINFTDQTGITKNFFLTGDEVYVKGDSLTPNQSFMVYLVPKTNWIDNMPIPAFVASINISTNISGILEPVLIWNNYIPNGSPDLGYDMILDFDNDNVYTSPKLDHIVDPLASTTMTYWTGSMSCDWFNNANWSTNSIPMITEVVSIPNVTNDPVIDSSGAVSNTIFLNTGAILTLSPQGGLTTYGTFSNNGTVITQSEISGAAGAFVALGELVGTGSYKIYRYLTSNNNLTSLGTEWNYVSSPISNATSGIFENCLIKSWNELIGLWEDVDPTSSLSVPINYMQGYATEYCSEYANDYKMLEFIGNPNHGVVSFDLQSFNEGFNLVGNPYPCPIDLEKVNIPIGMNNAFYFWDSELGGYGQYVQGVGGASQYIPATQGFFVEATSPTTLNFDNSIKTEEGKDFYYKNTGENAIVLQVEGNNYKDKSWIVFNSKATFGFDGKFDAHKLLTNNNKVPQIYSCVSGVNYSINSLPYTKAISICFTSGKPGNYNITIEDKLIGVNYFYFQDIQTGNISDFHSNPKFTFNYQNENEIYELILYCLNRSIDEYGKDINKLLSPANNTLDLTKTKQVPPDPGDELIGGGNAGAGPILGCNQPFIWTGMFDYDWFDPQNWDNFNVPTDFDDVFIPNVGSNYYPIISVNDALVNDLTIELGSSLTIIPTGTLTTNGLFKNDGTFFIESDESGTGSFINKEGIYGTGNATIERYFSGNDLDWHLISSPISNALADVFMDMYLQSFNGTPPAPYTPPENGYTEIIDPLTALDVMEGYALYSNLSTSNTVTFNGNLNFGTKSHAFDLNAHNPQGWNLLGNPFVSSIDWDMVTIPTEMNGEVHYLEAATGADIAYLAGSGGGIGSGRYIPPMQGFFVSALNPGTLQLNNATRTHTGAGTFYKTEMNDKVVLEASGNGYKNETNIYFNIEATNEHDRLFDAYKIITNSNPLLPQIYSITPAGVKLSINGMPASIMVTVGMIAGIPGEYTINAIETSELNNLILEDLITGLKTDLLNELYTFNYSFNEPENRFILHFTPMAINDNPASRINIYSSHRDVYVSVPINTRGKIFVYNLTGQKVASLIITDVLNKITLNNGCYVINVLTNENVVSKKVFVD